MNKWIKRLFVLLLVLGLGAGAFLATSYWLIKRTPSWYRPLAMNSKEMEAAANRAFFWRASFSLGPSSWVEKLFAADKSRLHRNWELHADPFTGVLLPRVFRAQLLRSALLAIPHA